MMKSRLIALLTDFGLLDPFVGMMKGVIAGLFPSARLIDISHEIPPGDILRAAVTLWQSVPYFPAGTVFLVVVDPGVGTERLPVIVRSRGCLFIGPDNGVFSFVLRMPLEAHQISNHLWKGYQISDTFHGRDIFAPAAALAAAGETPKNYGPPIWPLIELAPPSLDRSSPQEICGEVLFPDRFGNLLTSLGAFSRRNDGLEFRPWIDGPVPEAFIEGTPTLALPDGSTLALVTTFSDLAEGGCGAVIGSSGLIEIVANRSSAADILSLTRGDRLQLIESTGE